MPQFHRVSLRKTAGESLDPAMSKISMVESSVSAMNAAPTKKKPLSSYFGSKKRSKNACEDSTNLCPQTVSQVISTMLDFPDSMIKQRECCVFLSKLDKVEEKEIVQDMISEPLERAMKCFPDDIILQVHALEAALSFGCPKEERIIEQANKNMHTFVDDQDGQIRLKNILKQGFNMLENRISEHPAKESSDIMDILTFLLGIKENGSACISHHVVQTAVQVVSNSLDIVSFPLQKKIIQMLATGAAVSIAHLLKQHMFNQELVKECCESLATLRNDSDIEEVSKTGGICTLLQVFDLYVANPDIICVALSAMKILMKDESNCEIMLANDGVDCLLSVLFQNTFFERIQCNGCWLLGKIGNMTTNQEHFAIEMISKTYEELGHNLEVVESIFKALNVIKDSSAILTGMNIVLDSMKQNPRNEKMQLHALTSIYTMTNDAIVCKEFVNQSGLNLVLSGNINNLTHWKVHEIRSSIVFNVARYQLLPDDKASHVIGDLLDVISLFVDNVSVQKVCLGALSFLCSYYLDHVLMCDIIWRLLHSMNTHTDEPTVQENGCAVLAIICAYTDASQQQGSLECILVAMAKHSDRKMVQSGGCKALLVLFQQQSVDAFDNINTLLPLLQASKMTFPSDCKDTVDKIMVIVEGHKNGGVPKDKMFSSEPLPEPILESKAIRPYLGDSAYPNSSTKLVFVGASDEVRNDVIHQLISTEMSPSVRKEIENSLGVRNYTWCPYVNETNSPRKDFEVNIIDFSRDSLSGLFFPPQAIYILVCNLTPFIGTNKDLCSTSLDDDVNKVRKEDSALFLEIDENVMHWCDVIEKEVVGEQVEIFPLVVSDGSLTSARAKERWKAIRSRFDERNFRKMSRGTAPKSRMIFGNEEKEVLTLREKTSLYAIDIKNKILEHAMSKHKVDVFLSDESVARTIKKVISIVRSLGRKEVVMKWMQLIYTIEQKMEIYADRDKAVDVALHVLMSEGDIRTFMVPLGGGPKEDVVLLNNDWLISAVQCIVTSGYEELRLEVNESKADMSLFEWEEDEFSELLLNCPVLSSEDIEILWQSTESVVGSGKNTTLAVQCLESILTKVGILVPIDRNCPTESSKIFFIPSLLEAGDPPAWSFKCSNYRMRSTCDAWIIQGSETHDIMKNIIIFVLQDIKDKIENSKKKAHSPESEPGWFTSKSVRSISDHEPRYVVREICCWKTSILVKVDYEAWDPDSNKIKRRCMESLIHLSDIRSPLCLSSKSLKEGEKILVVNWKGMQKDVSSIGANMSSIALYAVEKILMVPLKLCTCRRMLVCPCCLHNYPIADAAMLEYDETSPCGPEYTVKCAKGHRIGVSMVNNKK